jgi:hypothetical protein
MTTRWPVRLLLCGALLALLGAARASESIEPWGIFEDWKGQPRVIRGDRHRGDVGFGGQETKTQLVGSKLQMRQRIEGSQASDTGRRTVANRLYALTGFLPFTDPSAIRQIEVEASVQKYTMGACTVNEDPGVTSTRVRYIQILLALFNDGTSTGPGDFTGDVFATLQAIRDAVSVDAKDVFRVEAFLDRCLDAPCNSTTTLSVATLGFVNGKKSKKFRLIADPANDQVVAEFEDSKEFASVNVSYAGMNDSSAAVDPFARYGVSVSAAGCTPASGGPTQADVETTIGAIRTNQSAVVP